MSAQPELEAVWLRRLLAREQANLDEWARDDLRTDRPTPSRMQGLANTLAAGPGHNTPTARLGALAAYLAGQRKRAGKQEKLWKRVEARVIELETLARDLVREASGAPSPPADACRRAHLRLVESYLHLLVRRFEQVQRDAATGCR